MDNGVILYQNNTKSPKPELKANDSEILPPSPLQPTSHNENDFSPPDPISIQKDEGILTIPQKDYFDEGRKKVWKEMAREITVFGHTYPLIIPKWSDPRLIQIGILSTVNMLGQFFFHFGITPFEIFLVVGTSILLDIFLTFATKKIILFPASGFITGLSLAFLLQTSAPAPYLMYILAGILAIGSKQVITYQKKHIFNPSNIAIVYILLAFPTAYITPDNWNASLFILIPIILLGFRLILKARVIAVTFAYFISEIVFFIAVHHSLNSATMHALQIFLSSPSLLIFSMFMMTDPRTVPKTREGKITYAIFIALIHEIMSLFIPGSFALFAALFFTCMGVPAINWVTENPMVNQKVKSLIRKNNIEDVKIISSEFSTSSFK